MGQGRMIGGQVISTGLGTDPCDEGEVIVWPAGIAWGLTIGGQALWMGSLGGSLGVRSSIDPKS